LTDKEKAIISDGLSSLAPLNYESCNQLQQLIAISNNYSKS